jgi:hypothetical protein
MKRIAALAFYAVGALAILYIALYAYAAFTGHALQPGDPIHIFRRPDAPDYSWHRERGELTPARAALAPDREAFGITLTPRRDDIRRRRRG